MSSFLDFYTLLFLILAVVLFLRLRSVLGRRTGNERPPFDPYSRQTPDSNKANNNDNIVSLPRREKEPAAEAADEKQDSEIADIAPDGSGLNAALKTIMSADRTFEPVSFLDGARLAYEMIVTSFAEGNRKALKDLLSKDVFEGFEQVISDRESRGETIDFSFVGIDEAEIVEAVLKAKTAMITVRFRSQLISATKDSEGRIIDGDPNSVAEVTDIWTFARDVSSRDPNWKLIATEADQ